MSAFVDSLLQPIAKSQQSYLKDTTDFINFIETTELPEETFLVSLDVTSLYTNIPQQEGINTICRAYENFYGENKPIPTHSLREILGLILQENSFEFNGLNYLQTHGTAMGTKMAVAFANIFMSAVETEILSLSKTKPLRWKRYIDDIFSLWNVDKEEIEEFITLANQHHPTIKFTAEISDKEINFLDTIQLSSRAKDFTNKQSSTYARISNQRKLFNTPTTLLATHQGWKKASLRVRHSDF